MNIKEQNALIRQIAQRAEAMFARRGINVQWEYIASELKTVHNEICVLRLQDLLVTHDIHFAHDIVGIHEHLDIIDGSFRDGFSPRFAA